MADPLKARLFGYGVPYRVRWAADGSVQPLPTSPQREAEDLARELAVLAGHSKEEAAPEAEAWATGVPFGRCGVGGLPLEHLQVFHLEEGYLEVLDGDGVREQPVREGEMLRITPRTVVRLRARSRPGRRVLVAFQTQDRTPLLGNAAPFVLEGQAPDRYDERLVRAGADFARLKELAGGAAYRAALDTFFARMARKVEGDPQVRHTQEQARAAGAYGTQEEEALFARQREMLKPEVIERVRRQDPELFRFPGMFGGIATLFKIHT